MSEDATEDGDRAESTDIERALTEMESVATESEKISFDERRPLKDSSKTQPDLSSLINSKISELEKETTKDEEEEKEIARAVKAENKKLSTLVSETDTEIGKVNLLQKKYTSLFQDMQRLEREHARQRVKSEKFTKDLSVSKLEFSKAINMKHKLETLCRELQKENKRVKEDSKRLAESEQQKRVELNNKFESTIFEIKTKMDEDSGIVGRRRLEDNELKDKFRSFLEQYELREQHFNGTLRAKELEIQLSQARLEQIRKSSETNEQRAKVLLGQVSTFSDTESELRSQLNIYVDKFKQVEDTLNNSNDLFLNFRKEMEAMTKKTKKLEKENALIRSKCDTANKSILEMAEERAKYRKEIEALKHKSTKLENLCRALQHERASSNSSAVGANPNGHHVNGSPHDKGKDVSDVSNPTRTTKEEMEETSGSIDDNYSEASFELDDGDHTTNYAPEDSASNAIAGFLKVSDQEEKMIRERRVEAGQNPHATPDRDEDGYLAVSGLEKDLIGALRDASIGQVGSSQGAGLAAVPDATTAPIEESMSAKRSLFYKLITGTTSDGNLTKEARDALSEDERGYWDEAAERLAQLDLPFLKNDSGDMKNDWLQDIRHEFNALLMGDKRNLQLDAFKKGLSPEKLKDFQQQYDELMMACQSLVGTPRAAETGKLSVTL